MNQERVSNSYILRLRFLAAYALALALTVVPIGAAADTVFKCKGDDGQVHYQETKCEGTHGTALPPVYSSKETITNDPKASVIVYRNPKNAYFTMGSIEGYTTEMQVDTGANMVALPAVFAKKIGVKCESSMVTSTAGGLSQACKSKVRYLKLGGITLANVEVLILPNLGHVLLGQTALSRLKMEQENGEIHLSVIAGVTK